MSAAQLNPYIQRWLEIVEEGDIAACREQHQLAEHIRQCFEREDIYTDNEKMENYMRLSGYFSFDEVFPWEAFCLALHLCTFRCVYESENPPQL